MILECIYLSNKGLSQRLLRLGKEWTIGSSETIWTGEDLENCVILHQPSVTMWKLAQYDWAYMPRETHLCGIIQLETRLWNENRKGNMNSFRQLTDSWRDWWAVPSCNRDSCMPTESKTECDAIFWRFARIKPRAFRLHQSIRMLPEWMVKRKAYNPSNAFAYTNEDLFMRMTNTRSRTGGPTFANDSRYSNRNDSFMVCSKLPDRRSIPQRIMRHGTAYRDYPS